MPLFRERMGQLQRLDVVERFLEHDQIGGGPQFVNHLLPGIVRIGGADDDLDFRTAVPKMTDGLHAIPSGRHPHIHKRQRVRITLLGGLLGHRQPLLPLEGRINHKTGARRSGGALPKQLRLGAVEPDVLVLLLAENFPKIRMDRNVVVNDEYPVAGFGGGWIHKLLTGEYRGKIKVKVAPRPVPSLTAESEPPISRALSAPR